MKMYAVMVGNHFAKFQGGRSALLTAHAHLATLYVRAAPARLKANGTIVVNRKTVEPRRIRLVEVNLKATIKVIDKGIG